MLVETASVPDKIQITLVYKLTLSYENEPLKLIQICSEPWTMQVMNLSDS